MTSVTNPSALSPWLAVNVCLTRSVCIDVLYSRARFVSDLGKTR